MSEIPEPLRKHRQLEEASCAVSAFECIAKLHGFIKPDAFPLQSDPTNQKKGFGVGDSDYLKSLGLVLFEKELPISDAVNLIDAETKAGRFPLASQIVGKNASGFCAHVFVCAAENGKLLLIDPAIPKIQAEGKEGLIEEFTAKTEMYPVRKTVHVLWYSKQN